MDFVTELPLTPSKNNFVWIIVDRFTKCAHFLPVHTTYTSDKLAEIYICEIVRLHGVPKSIVSDRDSKFTARFWDCLHTALGSRLNFNTSYHPQTDGQSERVIQVLEDMLRCTTEKVKLICERLKAASDRQKSYADLKLREIEYVVGDRVFIKVSPWKKVMRFGRKRERYISDPSHVMPEEEIKLNPDLSYDEEPVEILASDSKVLRGRIIELVKVKWRHRGVEEATWERKDDMMEHFSNKGYRFGRFERCIGSSEKVKTEFLVLLESVLVKVFRKVRFQLPQECPETFREGSETFSLMVPKPCPKVSKPWTEFSVRTEWF
ncbi:hypothetical protein GQ457_09G016800 [Hibiscus cannabinus]